MKKFLFTLLTVLNLLSIDKSSALDRKVYGLVSVESAFGHGIGDIPGYEALDLFIAVPQFHETIYPFLNQTFYWLDSNRFASSTGIGVRWETPSRIVLGTNLFYDYAQFTAGSYNQLGLGFEFFGKYLDFRVNGYQPIGNKTHLISKCVFDDYIGDFVMIKRRFKTVMEGADGEVALHLVRRGGLDFYIAGGGYYYHSKPAGSCTGGSVRAGLDYHRYLRIEGHYYQDNLFGSNALGIVRLSLPFDFLDIVHDYMWDILMQPIERQRLPVSHNHCCWFANF